MAEAKKTEPAKPTWFGKKRHTWVLPDPIIDDGGGKHNEIMLKEPTVANIEAIEGLQGSKVAVQLITLISGKPETVIKELPISLFEDMTEFVMHFTGATRQT